jgi:hypothetical protein
LNNASELSKPPVASTSLLSVLPTTKDTVTESGVVICMYR